MENDISVAFLYGTFIGRLALKGIMWTHLDLLIIFFLRSRLSHSYMIHYAKKHGIALSMQKLQQYRTFHDFFIRHNPSIAYDPNPLHVISPCDGYLSVYDITEDGPLAIKGSHYGLEDILPCDSLATKFHGGLCLVFRLCASDYHRYIYIDDGYQHGNHFIEGQLHSVQPIACKTYPVYALNRRSWTIMDTRHFGSIAQIEIGALIVGGIVNNKENTHFHRGEEKGHFELAGSTIVILFEQDTITLLPQYASILGKEKELRVKQGAWLASRRKS